MAELIQEEGASGRKAEILRPAQIFDPVARALDLLGDRWTLVLVRQLLGGPKGFQELRVRTGIAPRVLSSRLRQLRSDGFVETEPQGNRSIYRATEKGETLAPIIASIARWWVHEGMSVREIDAAQFTETSALSVLEALPNLLREERARGVHVVFEIRLSGEGGGVYTVEIDDGSVVVATSTLDTTLEQLTREASTGAIRLESVAIEDMDLEALFRYTVES